MITLRPRRGITMPELMLAVFVLALVMVPLAGLVTRSMSARNSNQVSLAEQQTMDVVLTRFPQDVRASNGLVSSLNTTNSVTLRQPLTTSTFKFVTYRVANDALQRGEAATDTAPPASWENITDPGTLKLTQGSFAFFTSTNEAATTARAARRIEFGRIVMITPSGVTVTPPAVSGVMREQASAYNLRASNFEQDSEGSAKWYSFDVANLDSTDFRVMGMTASWVVHKGSESELDTLKADDEQTKFSPKYSTGDPFVALEPFTIRAKGSEEFRLKFKGDRDFRPTSLVLYLYNSLSDRSDPAVVYVIVGNEHDDKDHDGWRDDEEGDYNHDGKHDDQDHELNDRDHDGEDDDRDDDKDKDDKD